jgi:predicted PurR-regulated permease PerM
MSAVPAGSHRDGEVAVIEPAARTRQPWSLPLWIIALCAAVALLRFCRDALIPIALALLAACILSGTVEALRRRHVPRAVSAAVLLVLIAIAIGATVDWIATPAQAWMQSAPRLLRTIEHKVRPAQTLVRRLDYIARRASAIAGADPDAPAPATAAPPPLVPTAMEIFAATGWAALTTVTVMAFAFLLLAAGPSALARLTCLFAAGTPALHGLRTIEAIRREVGRYYATLLLINVCFGAVLATTLWLLGMPSAPLWGVLGAILNFVPYVGPAVGVTIVTLVALVTFPGTAQALLVAACYVALATVEGHIVEPVFLARRLKLNSVVVLFALWIGGWLWGVAGVLLAMPVLLAIKVAGRAGSDRAVPLRTAHAPEGVVATGVVGAGVGGAGVVAERGISRRG